MKRTFPVIILAAMFLIACASLERNAYRTIGSLAVTVDAAMSAWGQYVRDGKSTVQQQAEVKQRYEEYQASMRILQGAVSAYRLKPDDTALNKALNVASATATDLTVFIYSFVQPSKKGP